MQFERIHGTFAFRLRRIHGAEKLKRAYIEEQWKKSPEREGVLKTIPLAEQKKRRYI